MTKAFILYINEKFWIIENVTFVVLLLLYKLYNKITIKVENSNIINHLNKLCMVDTSSLSQTKKNERTHQPLDVFQFFVLPQFYKNHSLQWWILLKWTNGKKFIWDYVMWLWFSRKFCLKIVCLVISNIWLEVRI